MSRRIISIFALLILLSVECFSQTTIEQLYSAKKFKEAYELGLSQIEKSPKKVDLIRFTALSATELLLYNEATELYQKALKLSPKNAELHFDLGKHHGKFGKRIEEIHYYSLALKLNPRLSDVFSPLSYAYLKIKEFSKSDSFATKALSYNPHDFTAKFTKAICNYNFGNTTNAYSTLLDLLSLEPNNREVILNLGVINEIQNNFTAALQWYQKILELFPNDLDASIRIGVIYNKLNLKTESKNHFTKLKSKFPLESELIRTMAQIELSQGNIAGVKVLYNELLTIDSTPNTILKISDFYVETGSIDSAISLLISHIARNPFNIDLLMELGKLYGNINNYEEAIKIFKKVEKIQPNYKPCLYNLSIATQKKGFIEESLNYIDKLISLTPKDSIGFFLRVKSEIVLSKGDYLESQRLLEQVISINPKDAESWYSLGIISIHRNDLASTKKYLVKALELNPFNVECRKLYIGYLVSVKEYTEALNQCEILMRDEPFGADELKVKIKELMTQ